MSNIAIVLAAGNGTRMKTKDSKLLLKLDGKTVLERSVQKFLDVSDIDEVIVVSRQQDIDTFASLLDDERVSFAIGGATRQESVTNAVETIDDAELVIIHDGARPLVEIEAIENTIRFAKDFGAAAVGVPVKDTIKVVDKEGFVVDTPERSTLFAVQTPQAFDFETYKKALEKAVNDNKDFTDDCQLIEYYGKKVKMVEGDYTNIKITTPDDIITATQILKTQEI